MHPRREILAIALALSAAIRASASLPDGLAAYYDFESNLEDVSGNARHLEVATGTPEPAWAGGTVTRGGLSVDRSTLLAGRALNLVDADNDVLKAPVGSGTSTTASGTFDLGASFTVSAWHLLAPVPQNPSPRYFVFEAEDNFDLSWGISSGNTYVSYDAQLAGPSLILASDAWHHVVHVFSNVGDMITLTVYVNGELRGGISAALADMDFDRVVLGDARDPAGDREWDGLLDEIAFWTRALSPLEVEELYARGRAGLGITTNLDSAGQAFLGLAVDQPYHGRVTGGGLRALGSSAPILATPAPGYLFARWDGAFAGQPASFTHLVASSLQATAVFEQDATDADGDGLSAYEETVVYGTNPALRDTDGDGLSDGDEARVTYTDPLQDDAALIRRIAETFGPGYAGGMALETTRIASDSGAVARVLLTGLRGSADLLHWNPVPLAPPDIALTPSGLRVQLAVPAPTNTVPVYLLHGYPP